jgi:hypothetical protein
MQESGLISGYAESLASELNFDRSLSRCVRQEVEDHLREAAAADPEGGIFEAERRAIANFGNPRAIAAQFAIVSLAKQNRRLGTAAVLAIAGVYLAMKARVAWYAAMDLAINEDMRTAAGIVIQIDHYATWLSIIIGMTGWVYVSRRGAPASFSPAYRRYLRRSFLLCTAATGAVGASVISDAALTALTLSGKGLAVEFVIPMISMAIEIACAGVLVFRVRCMTQRTASTAALLKV